MYLPTFVQMTHDLATNSATVQLTLTSFMAGIAVGQLFVGPLSDARGRRPVLVAGAAVFLVTSVAAMLATSIWVLIVIRLLMGAAGGTGAVCSRAVISDLETGAAAARAFSIMMAIQGLAPIIAPILGGLLGPRIGWRGIFAVIAGFNLLMLLAALFVVPESLPQEKRSNAGLAALWRGVATACRRRVFVGYTLVLAIGFGVLFAYISASPYVLQQQLGLSSKLYALAFAINSMMIALASLVNVRLIRRFHPRNILRTTLGMMCVTTTALVLNGLFGPWLWLTLPMLAVTVFGVGLIFGNATALGTGEVGDVAGAGSGVMGAIQFLVGGLVSPLVGLGSSAALSMGVVMCACAVLALACLALTRRS
ncbi:multidrug effflux MFS transporter [Cutibacterium equinum]|uniref:Multidrug effflux MFS transporter n=1 Tax=Cutibacterium equinum TaxID=3016342 RepID=A0ABY7QXK1_9ACTN|nr:multidrug effflux MFS transporter [Cutibacterium equinum]WCC79400.1 multidrug effflux MFS transporter [Cutibacterium equinum]